MLAYEASMRTAAYDFRVALPEFFLHPVSNEILDSDQFDFDKMASKMPFK